MYIWNINRSNFSITGFLWGESACHFCRAFFQKLIITKSLTSLFHLSWRNVWLFPTICPWGMSDTGGTIHSGNHNDTSKAAGLSKMCAGDEYNIGYSWESHLKLKTHIPLMCPEGRVSSLNKSNPIQNSYVHNIHCSCQIVLQFCTEHGSITVMLSETFQNDWISDK